MPRAFAWLILTFVIGSVPLLSADERGDGELAVTIQIHDYCRVSNGSLTRARAVVTAMYKRIGVRTEWLGVVQQPLRSARRDEISRIPIAQVTLIILTPKMAARGHVAEGALGFAAVPEEGMGRIAYAIYDRVRDTATRAAISEDDLLGFVMAHEIDQSTGRAAVFVNGQPAWHGLGTVVADAQTSEEAIRLAALGEMVTWEKCDIVSLFSLPWPLP